LFTKASTAPEETQEGSKMVMKSAAKYFFSIHPELFFMVSYKFDGIF
jgi:hypothetical protein